MTRYRWDFEGKRVSVRKGGRIALVNRHTNEVLEWIDPDDQEEFSRQYDEHLEQNLQDAFKDPRWGKA